MPNAPAIRIALRLQAEALDPAAITRALGCTPDFTLARGDVLSPTHGRDRVARAGIWLKEAPTADPDDPDARIAALLALATDDLDAWRRIVASCRADLVCRLPTRDARRTLSLAPATLAAIAARGLALDIDLSDDRPAL